MQDGSPCTSPLKARKNIQACKKLNDKIQTSIKNTNDDFKNITLKLRIEEGKKYALSLKLTTMQ